MILIIRGLYIDGEGGGKMINLGLVECGSGVSESMLDFYVKVFVGGYHKGSG